MNFLNLLQADCGQSNPISQMMRHVTEDQRFQESVGDSRSSIVPNNLMPPQSFRMNDLMKEIGEIESQRMPIAASPSSSHFAVQNNSSPGTMWTTEYQNYMQEISQPQIQQLWDEMNAQSYGNETNHFPAGGFTNNMLSSPPFYNFESEFQEPREILEDLEGTITIENVSELELLNQPEENTTYLQEIQDKQLPEKNCKNVLVKQTIPEFSSATHFYGTINTIVNEYRKKDWDLKHPNEKFNEVTLQDLLNPKVYSHIENNPMRDEFDPFEKGKMASESNSFFKAELCYDEAIRRNKSDYESWLNLSYALLKNKKPDKAISAIKHYLQFNPDCFNGAYVMCLIYYCNNCTYQACQSIFNWLKNNKSYEHLIPLDFSMDDKDTTELDDELLDRVKNIFLKATRQNPTNIDADLQAMIGELYTFSEDYDKVADCKLAAINCSERLSAFELNNMGYLLLFDEKPYEALTYFFKAAEKPGGEIGSYKDIAITYMYLQNYREAIYYLKEALGPESLGDESKFQLQGNTLEDEYELCLRLYCEFRTR